jgi:predicted ferric reductase
LNQLHVSRKELDVSLQSTRELDALPPAMPLHSLLLMLLAIGGGVFGAVVALPSWLPGLSASLLGPEPKAYWYLSRSSAIVAYLLLWVSMATGLAISNRMARIWPGGPVAFDLHQHTSLLGLGFALFHALILIGDRYIGYTLGQVLIPFAGTGYQPLWVGLGQIGWYVMALVSLTFYVRRRIGHRLWRLIHLLSYLMFALALLHGLLSGTDSGAAWARGMYWASAASLLFLTIYRILCVYSDRGGAPKRAARP